MERKLLVLPLFIFVLFVFSSMALVQAKSVSIGITPSYKNVEFAGETATTVYWFYNTGVNKGIYKVNFSDNVRIAEGSELNRGSQFEIEGNTKREDGIEKEVVFKKPVGKKEGYIKVTLVGVEEEGMVSISRSVQGRIVFSQIKDTSDSSDSSDSSDASDSSDTDTSDSSNGGEYVQQPDNASDNQTDNDIKRDDSTSVSDSNVDRETQTVRYERKEIDDGYQYGDIKFKKQDKNAGQIDYSTKSSTEKIESNKLNLFSLILLISGVSFLFVRWGEHKGFKWA